MTWCDLAFVCYLNIVNSYTKLLCIVFSLKLTISEKKLYDFFLIHLKNFNIYFNLLINFLI